MGLEGIALALNFTAFLLFAFVTLFTFVPELSVAVFCFDRTSVSSLGPFLRLGLPTLGSLITQVTAWSILPAIAQLRGMKFDDTLHVALQVVALTYFAGFGLQEASSALVGALFGGKKIQIAQ